MSEPPKPRLDWNWGTIHGRTITHQGLDSQMAGSSIKKRLVTSMLASTVVLGALAAGYVGTAAAWVTFLELLGFLAVAVAAGMACPSLDELSGPNDKA